MRESNVLIIISSKVWLQTELDDMMSCYQLIKTMKKFQKQTTYDLYVFIKKNFTRRNAWQRSAHMRHTVQLHKHDVCSVLIVLKTVLW